MMVLIHNGILDQRGKMKKVTKNGYQTMAIPKSAHKILVKTRNMKAQSPLFCGDRFAHFLLIDTLTQYLKINKNCLILLGCFHLLLFSKTKANESNLKVIS